MTQSDMLFLVLILIGLTSLTLVIVRLVRSRRRGDSDRPGNWWEGPWDEDRRG